MIFTRTTTPAQLVTHLAAVCSFYERTIPKEDRLKYVFWTLPNYMKLAVVAIHGYKRFHFIFLSPFCLWYIQIDISYYFYYDSKDPSLKS
jgi:hypothetical protein